MKTISLSTKNLALGLATVGLATATSLIGADSAEAAKIKFTLDGVTTSDGGSLNGTFVYNTDNPDLYENFNISGTPGVAITTPTFYGSSADSPSPAATDAGFPTNSGDFLTVQDSPSFPRSTLVLEFDGDLTSVALGDSVDIVAGTTGFGGLNPSFELLEIDARDSQARAVSGGLVTASNVPEPVTILGTIIAGGIGAAMKKRKGQLS